MRLHLEFLRKMLCLSMYFFDRIKVMIKVVLKVISKHVSGSYQWSFTHWKEKTSERFLWFLFQIATSFSKNKCRFFFHFRSPTYILSLFRTNIAMIEMQGPSNSLVYITPLKLMRNSFLLGVMVGTRKQLIYRIICRHQRKSCLENGS